MLLKLADSKGFLDAISIMSELVTEIKIKVTKAGLSTVAVDPATVALVSFRIPAASFTEFEANDDELCVKIEDLKQILKRAEAGSLITLEKKEGKLAVTIQNEVKRSFTLALINIDEEERGIPNLDKFSSKVEMSSGMLQRAIDDASIVSDSCTFVTAENFTIEAKGDLNSCISEFDLNKAKFTGTAKSKYSLEYLQKFIKAGKISDIVQIQYGNDYPARLDFKGLVEMTFVLAPRSDEE
jgi:proliferating cell nuclear antigen